MKFDYVAPSGERRFEIGDEIFVEAGEDVGTFMISGIETVAPDGELRFTVKRDIIVRGNVREQEIEVSIEHLEWDDCPC
jgi:hypothetical protein